jgi:hypothetical protein
MTRTNSTRMRADLWKEPGTRACACARLICARAAYARRGMRGSGRSAKFTRPAQRMHVSNRCSHFLSHKALSSRRRLINVCI